MAWTSPAGGPRMKRRTILTTLATGVMPVTSAAQLPPSQDPLRREHDVKLPSGKSQKDEILKADHEKNVEDARTLAKMTEDLRNDIEKSDRFVLSVGMLKRLDEVEKLVKKIRSRMKRY
jgi:hypothetical protein